MIVINRLKAEQIVKDRLRKERESLLAELDLQFMRNLEVGADTAAIAANKVALRNVTDKDLSGLSLSALGSLSIQEALLLP